ncbi:MAG: hypothetical protein SFV15_25380 [Polyangiaceae bacterium]|nr:hypothetical protein [Polyangiaceae bacterium]
MRRARLAEYHNPAEHANSVPKCQGVNLKSTTSIVAGTIEAMAELVQKFFAARRSNHEWMVSQARSSVTAMISTAVFTKTLEQAMPTGYP